MKLIIAIVQDEDAGRLISTLMQNGYGVTKLATTGGFLRAGNTTLLVGVDEDRYNPVMEIIEKVCRSRKQVAPTTPPLTNGTGSYMPYPVEVVVGGATIFVLEVANFKKF